MPKHRIFVAGSGSDATVYKLDQAFHDLLFEVHDYSTILPAATNDDLIVAFARIKRTRWAVAGDLATVGNTG